MKSAFLFAAMCACIGPLGLMLTVYVEGWFNCDDLLFNAMLMLGGGFASAAVFLAPLLVLKNLRQGLPRKYTITLLIAVFIGHYLAVFVALPKPMYFWDLGFCGYVNHQIGLDELQAWAEDALDRHDCGELKLDGNCDYVAGNAPKIAASELPPTIAGAWYWNRPQIALHDSGGNWLNDKHIAFTWYGYHLIVGRRNLKFSSEPTTLVYIRRMHPGIIFEYWDVR